MCPILVLVSTDSSLIQVANSFLLAASNLGFVSTGNAKVEYGDSIETDWVFASQ